MKVYKIRDTVTGLYSCGGYYPHWTKKGKTWSTLGQVKAAMTVYRTAFRPEREIPETWELVTLTIAEDEDPLPIRMLMGDK